MGQVVMMIVRDQPCCARCGIPMTSATADGREDGLYCDKCLEALIDEQVDEPPSLPSCDPVGR